MEININEVWKMLKCEFCDSSDFFGNLFFLERSRRRLPETEVIIVSRSLSHRWNIIN